MEPLYKTGDKLCWAGGLTYSGEFAPQVVTVAQAPVFVSGIHMYIYIINAIDINGKAVEVVGIPEDNLEVQA